MSSGGASSSRPAMRRSGNDSGDFTVALDDGRQIAGGRRRRDALRAPEA